MRRTEVVGRSGLGNMSEYSDWDEIRSGMSEGINTGKDGGVGWVASGDENGLPVPVRMRLGHAVENIVVVRIESLLSGFSGDHHIEGLAGRVRCRLC